MDVEAILVPNIDFFRGQIEFRILNYSQEI